MDLVAQRSALAMVPSGTSVRFAWAFIALATRSAGTQYLLNLLVDVVAAAAVEREVLGVLVLEEELADNRGAWSGDLVLPQSLSLARSW